MSRSGWIFVFLSVVMVGLSVVLPVQEWMTLCVVWLREQGTPGMIFFALGYAVATLIMLPMFPLGVLAGMVYGVAIGWTLVVPGLLMGSALAALLGGSLLRPSLLRMVAQRPKWAAVFEAFSKHGFRTVALARLIPAMPFGLQNYLLGASGISARDVVIGTAVAMQPAIVLALYLGTVVEDLSQINSGAHRTTKIVMLAVGLVAVGLFAWWIKRIVNRSGLALVSNPEQPVSKDV